MRKGFRHQLSNPISDSSGRKLVWLLAMGRWFFLGNHLRQKDVLKTPLLNFTYSCWHIGLQLLKLVIITISAHTLPVFADAWWYKNLTSSNSSSVAHNIYCIVYIMSFFRPVWCLIVISLIDSRYPIPSIFTNLNFSIDYSETILFWLITRIRCFIYDYGLQFENKVTSIWVRELCITKV